VCTKCQDAEERDYDKVRHTLSEQPNLNAEQVAEATGVDIECVLRMVEEGLVANVALLDGRVKCGMCGAPAISASKKLCQACLEKLNARVIQVQSQMRLDDKKEVQIGQALGGTHSAFKGKRRT